MGGGTSQIEKVARDLDSAYAGPPIAPVRDRLGSVEAAYCVQEQLVSTWLAQGRTAVGRKVGLTNPAVQRQLGVDQPDYGILMADRRIPAGGELNLDLALDARLEAEVALVLRRDIPLTEATVDDVARATAFALPALEIIDSRIAGWDIQITDTIADNASSGWFVLGDSPKSIDGLDLAQCSMSLRRNGEEASVGDGAQCLGHPLNAAAWLASTMARLGDPLRAGEIVLTGALGPVVAITDGDTFVATISELGDVGLRARRGGNSAELVA